MQLEGEINRLAHLTAVFEGEILHRDLTAQFRWKDKLKICRIMKDDLAGLTELWWWSVRSRGVPYIQVHKFRNTPKRWMPQMNELLSLSALELQAKVSLLSNEDLIRIFGRVTTFAWPASLKKCHELQKSRLAEQSQ